MCLNETNLPSTPIHAVNKPNAGSCKISLKSSYNIGSSKHEDYQYILHQKYLKCIPRSSDIDRHSDNVVPDVSKYNHCRIEILSQSNIYQLCLDTQSVSLVSWWRKSHLVAAVMYLVDHALNMFNFVITSKF